VSVLCESLLIYCSRLNFVALSKHSRISFAANPPNVTQNFREAALTVPITNIVTPDLLTILFSFLANCELFFV